MASEDPPIKQQSMLGKQDLHPDQYEDVQDFVDTMLEETDLEFQRSLQKGATETRRGHYLTHQELKLALAGKKLR